MHRSRAATLDSTLDAAGPDDQSASFGHAKDELISVLSHELRTPLTAILGWTRMLRNRKSDPAFVARALDVIERNTKAQANLIEELVDISRIEKGTLELNVGPVEVSMLLARVMSTVRPVAEAKKVALVTRPDPTVDTLTGDEDRLQQVLCNLLASAIKLTPASGRVELRLQRVAGGVEISITDSGAGIAPECLPYVFDVFRRPGGASSRRVSGLGLGLAIVPLLVRMHGGRVTVESDGLGKGTRFIVRLPQTATLAPVSFAGESVRGPSERGCAEPGHAESLDPSPSA